MLDLFEGLLKLLLDLFQLLHSSLWVSLLIEKLYLVDALNLGLHLLLLILNLVSKHGDVVFGVLLSSLLSSLDDTLNR